MKVGNFYHVDGLDMNCNQTVERVQLVEILKDNPNYDCVILSDGIKIFCNLKELR